MATIPASQIVQVLPGVLSAGGRALVLNGIMLSTNTRIPVGGVTSLPTPLAASTFFGASTAEAKAANYYFAGYDNSTQKPGSILYAQCPQYSVPAFLQSGLASQLSLAQLQGLTGSLTVTVDGLVRTASSINLSGATSPTAAAGLIATGLNATPPTAATVTGSIAPASATSITGSIAGNVLTVTAVTSGVLVPGATLSGTGVTAGTLIGSQLSGTTGGVGTYSVSVAQTVPSTAITAAYGVLTVTAVSTGTISVGQTVTGGTTTANTVVTGLGTGTGGTGTYYVNNSQTVVSGALTLTGTPVSVTYDSTSGSFFIYSGVVGTASTIGYATGTLAASLYLTAATGAQLSQGAAAQTAATFMNSLIGITQNWATFTTLFDPDGGVGNTQKQTYANWVNTTNNRYAYIAWDTDTSPAASGNATASLGNILKTNNTSGTCPLYAPDYTLAAFVMGATAAIDFNTVNGRITFAFKSQTGMTATVTDQTTASNLLANGYNFYGAYATANQNFVFLYNGSVTGPFLWLDSYINQIWLNNQFQLALMNMLVNTTSIPYNTAGYALTEAACADPISQGLRFGAFRAGVTLSQAQAAQVNNAAGIPIDQTLSQRGWYLQILDASPQVRQGRTSPPCKFWYMDGQAVQQITLNSINVQ